MSNSPIKTIRAGYVKATIWENTNNKGQVYHSIDISRSYSDKDGQWHETSQMFTEQLPQLRLASDNAYAFIYERLNELKTERKNQQQEEAEQSDKPAPAKKRGQRKSHTEKVEEERATTAKGK